MAGRRHPLHLVRLPGGHRTVVVAAPSRPRLGRRYTRPAMSGDSAGVRLELGFRLGEWTVRPAQNRLVSPRESRHLEPRAMDLLCALAARPGRVVDKDTLVDQVWEGRIISEGTLSNTVAELRQVLADDARSPRFIETIPKRGYRLLVAPAPVEPERPARRRVAVRWWIGTAAAVVVAAAVIVLDPWASRPATDGVDHLPCVRVEPFIDRTEGATMGSLAPMVTDWVVKSLVDSGLVRVARGPRPGSALLVVTGSCYGGDGECSCRADVARDDGTLIAALEPPTAREPATVVEQISQTVTGAVAAHLNAHAHTHLPLSRPPRLDAWQEYQAGSVLFGGDTAAAAAHLERAAELDPGFFSARFRLAYARRQLGLRAQAKATLAELEAERERRTPFERLWLDVARAQFEHRFEEARSHLADLQKLLPGDPAVNHLAGATALALNRPAEALRDYRQIELGALEPEYRQAAFTANVVRSQVDALHRLGRDTEALELVETARSVLAPSPILDAAEVVARAGLGQAEAVRRLLDGPMAETPDGPDRGELLLLAARGLRSSGRRAASLELASLAEAWWRDRPGEPSAAPARCEALAYAERWPEAEALLRDLVRERPEDPRLLGWLAVAAGRQSDRETVAGLAQRMARADGGRSFGWHPFWRAVVAAEFGDGAAAAELLERARREGWGSWWMLLDSMLLEPVRDDPAVREVLKPRG